MASEDTPADIGAGLERLRAVQGEVADALSHMMIGIMQVTGWMQPR
ncbi:MAG: hypothetical protein QGF53_05825 [Alphaproteobacteria bacterium]|jgi:hypothetical protein|nr:hypothetical protein [Alphaproteobacteria bacterium]